MTDSSWKQVVQSLTTSQKKSDALLAKELFGLPNFTFADCKFLAGTSEMVTVGKLEKIKTNSESVRVLKLPCPCTQYNTFLDILYLGYLIQVYYESSRIQPWNVIKLDLSQVFISNFDHRCRRVSSLNWFSRRAPLNDCFATFFP